MTKDKKDNRKTAERQGRGNTNSLPKEGRCYCFTWNNYEKRHISDLIEWFKSRKNLEYVFQEEIGENGTPHLQGCFKSKSPIQFDTIKKKFPKVHWEHCRSWFESVNYCSKSDTKAGDVFTNIDLPEPLKHGFDMDKATEWQLKLINLVKETPDSRKIFWVYDEDGCKGKTTLAKYLVDTYPNKVLYMNGKAADVKYGVQEFLQNKKNNLKIALFGFPRTKENYVSYEAIEEVKDGIFFSTKYESGMVRYNIPHVIVLANFEPDYEALSKDRWEIIEI